MSIIQPIPGAPVTQTFGVDPEFYARWGYPGHNGIDLYGPIDTPVLAADDAIVLKIAFEVGGFGNYVVLQHNPTTFTYYAHLDSTCVSAGQQVRKGEQIGRVGMTGCTTGPHLHFGIKIAGENPAYKGYVDPYPYLVGQKSFEFQAITPAAIKNAGSKTGRKFKQFTRTRR
jgi:murein DD-endopeptidase MepM/ murein hydrolase activator NlpD